MRLLSVLIAILFVAMAWSVQAETEPTVGGEGRDGIGTLDEHEEEPFFGCVKEGTLDQLLGGSTEPTNVCVHGQFKRTDFGITHGFSGLPYQEGNWTGTLESRLVWAGTDREFRCTFEEGEIVEDSCEGQGVFPHVESTFWQECRAYDHLGLELEIALTDFGCMVTGNVEKT